MEITFSINGETYKVNKNVPITTSLNTFIRQYAQLPGTKFMCLEGGCGACIVNVKGLHPVSKKTKTWAINSCLTPVFSCHDLDITTVEGIGNRKDGYHKVQKRLTELNGTQCGYCSPGMVMNMYSLLEANDGKVSMKEIENSFGGNICRCTGYRPILDAFKSLAYDADPKLIEMCKDIEDLDKVCPKTGSKCANLCNKSSTDSIQINFDDQPQWSKVYKIDEIFKIFGKIGNTNYMLISGNTAHGVYRRDSNINVFIDVNGIEELRSHSIGSDIILGGNVNLTEAMQILTKASKINGFEYCSELVNHIDLIANVPVRNSGTLAGNLSIKHQHNEFPSDIFIILQAIGAKITISEGTTKELLIVTPSDYLKIDMNKKIILNITLPNLNPDQYKFRSYKIMPRAQNAHAYVNAGFLLKIIDEKIEKATICYGGINPQFIHAINTEEFLCDQLVFSNDTIQGALNVLSNEIEPDWVLPDAQPEYRKQLALSLFYKFILSICPNDKVEKIYKSGGQMLDRPLSSGTQSYDTYEEKWPLTQPVPKYEGLLQCSGEAQYTNDLPKLNNELWAAFATTNVAHGKISKIDPSQALEIVGVRHFFSAADIPGKNSFTPFTPYTPSDEEIFVGTNSNILFYGQPYGIILADTFEIANYAQRFIRVTYLNDENSINGNNSSDNPNNQKIKRNHIVPTIQEAFKLDAQDRFRNMPFTIEAKEYGNNTTKTLSGRFKLGSQYHYTIETQTTICIPSDEGIDVYSATQAMDFTQIAIAKCLNIQQNKVNMIVKRIGGGYGGKITRSPQIACACALGSYLTNQPVRFVLSMEANMHIIGKRLALISDYSVDVDNNGVIQKLTNNYAQDYGCSFNEAIQMGSTALFKNCYTFDRWDVKASAVQTNSPSNTWCRAPGSTEGIAMIENIMEHIARIVNKDPNEVRLNNIPEDSVMKKLYPDFLDKIEYYNRKMEIDKFNLANRWIKRGIAICPMKYAQKYFGSMSVFVAIYHDDGTVAITHGGIECGQGINTKVAQVAAHILGIPLNLISVKSTNNLTSANSSPTVASMTSEVICHATKIACEELLEKMEPIRREFKNPTWSQLTSACHDKLIDLTSKYMYKVTDLTPYFIWGISCAEIELDLLTGNLLLRRVDILEDTGDSMSPLVDVGQIEGAFIMGIGYWLTEYLVYNSVTGKLLTDRTWTYKPPGAKDIPIDFRVTFIRNNPNQFGVLGSKATGEPSICMSIVVIFALRYALESARKHSGLSNEWFHLGAPSTPDTLFLSAGNKITDYRI